jgi:hypothetical protein
MRARRARSLSGVAQGDHEFARMPALLAGIGRRRDRIGVQACKGCAVIDHDRAH